MFAALFQNYSVTGTEFLTKRNNLKFSYTGHIQNCE